MPLLDRCTALLSALLLALLLPSLAAAQIYDPPTRVARLSLIEGAVSFSPAGEPDWVSAGINRPLIAGDRLWADRHARLELQLGSVALRADEHTALSLLDMDDEVAQFELSEGRLNLYVGHLHRGQSYEIATPTLALVITEPGSYSVEVARGGRSTLVQVWRGRADAYGERVRFPLHEGDAVRFFDPQLRDREFLALRADAFDRFCFHRDEILERSMALRYVSRDVIGYADLDAHGQWRRVREHGDIWFPTTVRADWAPYRYGHWIWQSPWGWTWVDDAPWGFAPSHYGRWVLVGGRWGWVPPPRSAPVVYAPALVAFVGGRGWSVGVNLRSEPIGWFPLGPRDVFVPGYRVSRDYFTRVNMGPTFISTTQVVYVYNNYYVRDRGLATLDFAYRGLPAAVTVVPSDVFVRSQPVSRAVLRVDPGTMTRAEVRRLASHQPGQRSIIGPAPLSQVQPRAELLQREVYVRREPSVRGRGDLPMAAAAAPRETGRAQQARSSVRVVDADAARTIERGVGDRGIGDRGVADRGRGRDARADTAVDPRGGDARQDPRSVARVDPARGSDDRRGEPTARSEPRAEARIDPRAEARNDPRHPPRAEARVDARAEVRPEPRSERRHEANPAAAPAPHAVGAPVTPARPASPAAVHAAERGERDAGPRGRGHESVVAPPRAAVPAAPPPPQVAHAADDAERGRGRGDNRGNRQRIDPAEAHGAADAEPRGRGNERRRGRDD